MSISCPVYITVMNCIFCIMVTFGITLFTCTQRLLCKFCITLTAVLTVPIAQAVLLKTQFRLHFLNYFSPPLNSIICILGQVTSIFFEIYLRGINITKNTQLISWLYEGGNLFTTWDITQHAPLCFASKQTAS